MRRRFLLIHNDLAGTGARKVVDQVVAELKRRNKEVVELNAREPSELEEELVRDDYDAVIAAGGDGTVRRFLDALAENEVPLGIIPVGTGNVLAYEIGLPISVSAVTDVLIAGPEFVARGGRIGTEPFLLMAGIGFDGAVVRRLNSDLKRRIGKAAFLWPILATLFERPNEFDVTVDQYELRASWVVVTKARHYGGAFTIAAEAGLNARAFQVILFKGASRLVRTRQLLALALGMLKIDPSVEFLSANRVSVKEPPKQPVQVDGDPIAATPVVVTTGPQLRLIVPRRYTQ